VNSDPWSELAIPNAADAISARRVDADNPWGFYWARGIDRKYLLVLKHTIESMPHGRFPRLKGIEVVETEGSSDGERMLIFQLNDSTHRDIFQKLCADIVARASSARSEEEAVEVALARTWRWHHLLRGGSDGRMSPEEQKGLIGELFVLERYLLPRFSALDAISAWHGPSGAPKDFEIGRICVEAKARRGAATPYLAISSEHQLDDTGVDALFLHVIELSQAPASPSPGLSVTDAAQRIRQRIIGIDGAAEMAYEGLLAAAGFRWEDDYSDSLWLVGDSRLYAVKDGFPRITAPTVTPGVCDVKYSVSLAACEAFQVADAALESALEGQHGD